MADGRAARAPRGCPPFPCCPPAVHPAWLGPLTHWYFSVRRPGVEQSVDIERLDADTFVLGDGPWDRRVWLVVPVSYATPDSGLRPCAPTWTRDDYRLLCLEAVVGS